MAKLHIKHVPVCYIYRMLYIPYMLNLKEFVMNTVLDMWTPVAHMIVNLLKGMYMTLWLLD